jgi:predicted ATPase
MSPEERASCHHEIGVALLSIIPIETNFNALKFTAINQINRSEPYGVTDPSRHVEYASINLKAGERSLGMSDFELALDYIKCGLTFLN